MMAAFGFGALFGATLAGSGAAWPSGRRVRVLALATGAEICLAATAPGIAWLYAGMAFAGFLSIWFIALANALVQIRAEPEMRGRMMGLWSMALPGMSPITSLIIGGVASWGGGALGARESFGLAGVALMISAVIGWRAMADKDPASNAPARPDSAPNGGLAVATEGDCVLPPSGTTSAGPAGAAR